MTSSHSSNSADSFRTRGDTLRYVAQFRISDAARLLAVSDDTVRRWIAQGRLATIEATGPLLIEGTELAAFALELGAGSTPESSGSLTPTSARNRFPGIVTAVKKDLVMAQVDVQAGPFRIVSLISSEAVDELGLEVGAATVAVVKATNVVLERPNP
jgi:molybdopterin-binding protein